MTARRIEYLLDRIGCVKTPCDLDLLLFFYRHPRAFLLSDRLAKYVGYELPHVARSLETLITAGLLRQSPHSTYPARLYVLRRGSTLAQWLSLLLRSAATREGRLAVIRALKQRPSSGPSREPSSDCEPEPIATARAVLWAVEGPHA